MTIVPFRPTRFRRRSARRQPFEPVDLVAMAYGFAGRASDWPGLDDPLERCWRTIAATERFEAWVVAWPVGGTVELHDHGGSAGAVVVASGTLVELSLGSVHGEPKTNTKSIPGHHLSFGRGHIHDFVNHGPDPALSVHVYTPALQAMTYFDWADEHDLVAVRTDEYFEGALIG